MISLCEVDGAIWKKDFSEHAHKLAFSEIRAVEQEKADYALLVIKDNVPVGYATVCEMSQHWGYLQYGGAFDTSKKTSDVYEGVRLIAESIQGKYDLVTTYVEQHNLAMIKLWFKFGFLVSGFRVLYKLNYVELAWNKNGST